MTAAALTQATGVPSWIDLLPAAAELARSIADTDFVPDAFRRKPAAIAACVMYGAELGVGPMTALAKIDIVKGRPAPRAELGRALAIAAGHRLWLEDATNTRVTMAGQRRGEEHVHAVTWTMDDAKRAGLTGSTPWRAYPRAMLTARATTELLRVMCPEVLGGILVFAEEVDDQAPAAVEVKAEPATAADSEPAKATSRRRRPRPPAPAPATEVNERQAVDVDLDGSPPALGAPAPAAVDDDDMIAATQLKALHAALTAADLTARDDRLAFATAVVGHHILSSRQLTRPEASTVIDHAHDLAAGKLAVTIADDGHWTLDVVEDVTS